MRRSHNGADAETDLLDLARARQCRSHYSIDIRGTLFGLVRRKEELPDQQRRLSKFDAVRGCRGLPEGAGHGRGRRRGRRRRPWSAAPGEIAEVADLASARTLANLGWGGAGDDDARAAAKPLLAAQAAPQLAIDIDRALAFLHACETSTPRVTYGLGAKVPFLGAVPGRDFQKVDCSGFVREAIRRSTNRLPLFPMDRSCSTNGSVREDMSMGP